jgi:hypothetical protein
MRWRRAAARLLELLLLLRGQAPTPAALPMQLGDTQPPNRTV